MEKIVVIEIDERGDSSLDLLGFQGTGCADVAKQFQGNDTVVAARNKREFYVQAPARVSLRRKEGGAS